MTGKLVIKRAWGLLPAGILVAGLGIAARLTLAADNPHLAGKWTLNKDQSDDANQKIREAETSARSQRGNYPGGGGGGNPGSGEGYPGGGIGYPRGGGYAGGGGIGYPGGRGGMGGGPMGGGRRGGSRIQGGGLSHQDLAQLAANPKLLRIEQDGKPVRVSDDLGQIRNFHADGKKHKEKDSSGQSVTTKARWDGDRLVAQSKLGHSGKLTETFAPGPDGKQLVVITQLDNSQLPSPLVIRRVYDSAAPGAK